MVEHEGAWISRSVAGKGHHEHLTAVCEVTVMEGANVPPINNLICTFINNFDMQIPKREADSFVSRHRFGEKNECGDYFWRMLAELEVVRMVRDLKPLMI